MTVGRPAPSVDIGDADRVATLPSAAVVVCVYTGRRWAQIKRAIDSLRDQTPAAEQIVVVVDYNPDLEERLQVELRDVLVTPNTHERGLSGARNTGIGICETEVVVFLDDDARADSGWLRSLLEPYSDPAVMGVGGLVIPDWPASGSPSWLPSEFLWVVGCTHTGMPTERERVRNPIGANMSFRRSAFSEAGLFRSGLGRDSSFGAPLGCEETEFSIRLQQVVSGAQVLHEPRAVVRHEIDASRLSFQYFRSRCAAEGRSKARVARAVGADQGLSVERDYLIHTLWSGGARELRTFLHRPSPRNLARVGAMLTGVTWALVGYIAETARLHLPRSSVTS